MLPFVTSHVSFAHKLLQSGKKFGIDFVKVVVVNALLRLLSEVCDGPKEFSDVLKAVADVYSGVIGLFQDLEETALSEAS